VRINESKSGIEVYDAVLQNEIQSYAITDDQKQYGFAI